VKKIKPIIELIDQLNEDGQAIIQELLEGTILKYEARRWTRAG